MLNESPFPFINIANIWKLRLILVISLTLLKALASLRIILQIKYDNIERITKFKSLKLKKDDKRWRGEGGAKEPKR